MDDDRLLHGVRRLVGTELLAPASAVSWWAWTAWDLRRDVEPSSWLVVVVVPVAFTGAQRRVSAFQRP